MKNEEWEKTTKEELEPYACQLSHVNVNLIYLWNKGSQSDTTHWRVIKPKSLKLNKNENTISIKLIN